MNDLVALMRRYVTEYVNRQDFSIIGEIMAPDYTLHMGESTLSGRDDNYKPAVMKQFGQFNGLCLTVHDLVVSGDRIAMRFSEHGASKLHDCRAATWEGIGIYAWNGAKLIRNYVEQDYFSRRRQLDEDAPLDVNTPAIAPWDVRAMPASPTNESIVRAWLETGTLASTPGVLVDDQRATGHAERILEQSSMRVDDIFSAGDKVAFHVTQEGTLLEDFARDINPTLGQPVRLHSSGIVRIADGRVASGEIIRDRWGLYRRLNAGFKAKARAV